jgi:uncharacterized protein (TIGR02466 family)
MEEIHYNFYYSGPLLFKTSVSKNDLDDIKLLCKDHKNKNFKRNTTGIAEQEYKVDCFKLQNILQKYLDAHEEAYYNWYNKKIKSKLICKYSWVNYMESGECNPVHIHPDSIFSSVIFIQNPKNLEKEINSFNAKITKPGTLNFEFSSVSDHYIDTLNIIPKVGDFYIFPSNLKHSVNSFKSKGERISLACNFNYKT